MGSKKSEASCLLSKKTESTHFEKVYSFIVNLDSKWLFLCNKTLVTHFLHSYSSFFFMNYGREVDKHNVENESMLPDTISHVYNNFKLKEVMSFALCHIYLLVKIQLHCCLDNVVGSLWHHPRWFLPLGLMASDEYRHGLYLITDFWWVQSIKT